MEPVRASKDFKVEIEPHRLWPIFANTDQMNRAARFDAVVYDPAPKGAVVRTARSKLLGFLPSSWEEPPYEFAAPRYYLVSRRMHGGPFAQYSFSIRLHPEGGGTRVEIQLDMLPRNAVFAWFAQAAAGGVLEKMASVLTRFSAAAIAGRDNVFAPENAPVNLDRRLLAETTRKIEGRVSGAVLEKITAHLAAAVDRDVLRMRPFVLADAWKTDRLETLRAFLYGSRSGLFNMTWEVLCPNCRVAKDGSDSLSQLRGEAHCDTCEIDFTGLFDANVEVRFSVHPSIRKAVHSDFCIGSPAKSPHRALQAPLEGKQSRVLRVELDAKPYFFRGFKDPGRVALIPDEKASDSVTLRFENGAAVGAALRFKPGMVILTLENTTADALWAAVDAEEWADLGATAAFVTTLQDFRDLFSSEILSPGQNIAIENLAILFTDLKDSTATYTKIGDARAYALVRTHFEILISAMRAHNGGVVKTIGDAVMAAFTSTADGFAAAMTIQTAIADYNRTRETNSPEICVKLGLHAGPAIAVTMNDVLDYFGTTVNTAARVQSRSEGSDIVLTREILDCPGVRGMIEGDGGELVEFQAELKGLSESLRLWRFIPKSATITRSVSN